MIKIRVTLFYKECIILLVSFVTRNLGINLSQKALKPPSYINPSVAIKIGYIIN